MNMKKILIFALAALACLPFLVSPAYGNLEFEVTTTKDSWVKENDAGTNFGTDTKLQVKNNLGYKQRSYVWFNLSSLPDEIVVVYANFSLYYYDWSVNNPNGRWYSANRITEDWNETDITWNNQPASTGVNKSLGYVPLSFGWMSWDITNITQEWADGTSNYGLVIRDIRENLDAAHVSRFYSREYNGLDPRLEIEYYIPRTCTFRFTTGGQFRVDNATMANGTSITYVNGTIIELAALPYNRTYVFLSFNGSSIESMVNPYNFTVAEPQTIWLYYGESEGVEDDDDRGEYIAVGVVGSLIIFPACILVIWAIQRRH